MSAASAAVADVTTGDGDLVARARSGDAAAFTTLLRRHDRQQRALAHRMLGPHRGHDRGAIDDALQDAYVKAWRSLDGFRGDARFSTWLHRITYRTCVDELRRHRQQHPLEDASLVEDHRAGPDTIATDRTALGRALDALPTDQRAAVVLVDAHGLSYEEAAEVLDVAPGTVASRLNRARAAFRGTLDPQEPQR